MSRGRLEAFSDAVIAIVMTIMVLEIVPPEGATVSDLRPLVPIFVSYVLSFANLAIWWINHHHHLQAVQVVNGRVLWANMLLLLCLSLFPFATAWMGESGFASQPVAVYAAVQFAASLAYYGLLRALVRAQPPGSPLEAALGRNVKGVVSLCLFAASVPVALVAPYAAVGVLVFVAVIWIVPDARVERSLTG
jgi:uncharacterized membrane protein